MKILNAKNTPLNANVGNVPDVSGPVGDYSQPITFKTVVKTTNELFQVVETPTTVSFLGSWQPLSPQQIAIKPEGERAWKWFQCHSTTALALAPDDVVTYLGTQFRVKAVNAYNLYGYYEYHLVEDYTGAGPT